MTVLHSIRSAFSTLQAAVRVASAVEMHRLPATRDLETLGISRSAFRTINL